MAKIFTKGLMGMEDMNRGMGTFSRATSTGGTQTLTQIPLPGTGVRYVGAEFAAYYGTSDIGAQINAAYAALPATGGVIQILPNTNGALYSFTTPILFGTLGKWVVLQGLSPSNTVSGFINGGITLNFTPTAGPTTYSMTAVATAVSGFAVYTGTFANGGSNALAGKIFRVTGFTKSVNSIVVNNGYHMCTASSTTSITLSNGLASSESGGSYTASLLTTAVTYANCDNVGDGYNPGQYIADLSLTNNASSTVNGGTGNATVGIDFSGEGRLSLRHVLISGFGVGALFASGKNWGARWNTVSVVQNNVGVMFYNGMENFSWSGGTISVNDVGFSFSGASIPAANSTFEAISIDSNLTFGIKETAGSLQTLTFVGCHFENLTTIPVNGNVHYIYTETATVLIYGGTAIDDDATAGDPATDWWISVGYSNNTGALGNFFYLGVYGLLVQPAGRVATAVFRVGGRAFLSGEVTTPAAVTSIYTSSSGPGFVTNLYQNNSGFSEASMEISGKVIFDNGVGGVTPNHQVFTNSGTFTIPTGITAVKVTVVAGGGGGGGSTGSNCGAGGGAGGCGIKWLTGLTPTKTLTVTVGGGGAGNSGSAGSNGVASSVASGTQTITTISTNPGLGGGSGAAPQAGQLGGAAGSGGDINMGGGGSSDVAASGSATAGGGSFFGGGGASGGNAGSAYGSGGGGSRSGSTTAGGVGQQGIVVFEWVS